MKDGRPLGQDRPSNTPEKPLQFQGVVATSFPKPNLGVSLDAMLEGMEEEASLPVTAPQTIGGEVLLKGELHPNEMLVELRCDLIDVSPYQPRLDFTEEELELLAQAIAAAQRVNRPILVRRKADGRYELIGGERRWRAVLQLGWDTIPARIVDADDDEAQVLAIADNEGQQGLSDYENGRAYQKVLERKAAPSIRALATRIGVSHPTVVRRLALTKLPPACLEFMDKNPRTLGVKLASEFVAVGETHPELVLQALVKIDQEGMSQEQALKWVQAEIKGTGQKGNNPAKRTQDCQLPGGLKGQMVISGNALKIKVPQGVDMDKLEELIMKALSNA